MLSQVIKLFLLVATVSANDLDDAINDRAKLYSTEQHVDSRFFYFSFAMVPETNRQAVITTFRYAICAASRNSHLESLAPIAITPTLYRIDLQGLGWDYGTFRKLMSTSDYKRAIPTNKKGVYEKADLYLVNHPWFIMELLDATESSSYNELVFGKAKPTRDDFFKSAKTIVDPNLEIRRIEGKSGVAIQGTRNLWMWPNGLGNVTTLTGDRFAITRDNSPLQSIDKDVNGQQIDASEGIYGFEIFSSLKRQSGVLNRYWLGDGKGEFRAFADERVVSNSFGWRGHHSIVTPGGCVGCHQSGLNPISLDFFREYVESGGEYRVAKKEELIRLEKQLLLPINKRIDRYNEDFATAIELVTDLQPKEFVPRYFEGVRWFDEPVDIEQAARELYTDANTLKLAIAINDPYKLHEGLVRLAHGIPITRSLWADLYFECSIYLEQWE